MALVRVVAAPGMKTDHKRHGLVLRLLGCPEPARLHRAVQRGLHLHQQIVTERRGLFRSGGGLRLKVRRKHGDAGAEDGDQGLHSRLTSSASTCR